MNFGDRIKRTRGALTQKEFAQKIGTHVHTVQTYEQGSVPKGNVLQRIHKEFGVNIHWLLTGDGEPYIYKVGEGEKTGHVAASDPPPYEAAQSLYETLIAAHDRATEALQAALKMLEKALERDVEFTKMGDRMAAIEARLEAIEGKVEQCPAPIAEPKKTASM